MSSSVTIGLPYLADNANSQGRVVCSYIVKPFAGSGGSALLLLVEVVDVVVVVSDMAKTQASTSRREITCERDRCQALEADTSQTLTHSLALAV
jgi:hypothetical protein